jgi:hypothetical protein
MLAVPSVIGIPVKANRRAPVPPTLYSSPDGTFQISYPGNFLVCTAGKMEPCVLQSYIPPCDEDALVCVVYPKKKFEGTTFESAAFEVREIHRSLEEMTPDVCVTPSAKRDEGERFSNSVSAQRPEEMVDGVLFAHRQSGGVALGHSGNIDLYRAFHRTTCYELSLMETEGSPGNFDPPGKTLTRAEKKDMDDSLSKILHSFRFLK